MNKDENNREEVYIRAKIRGDILQKFMRIKKHEGLSADAEVVRLLITREYRRLFEETKG